MVDLIDSPCEPHAGHDPDRLCAQFGCAGFTVDNELIVANDKGWGSTGNPNPPLGLGTVAKPTATTYIATAPTTACSVMEHEFGVSAYFNTHQDLGIVSLVPVPDSAITCPRCTPSRSYQNNHWDLANQYRDVPQAGIHPEAKPVVIPAQPGRSFED